MTQARHHYAESNRFSLDFGTTGFVDEALGARLVHGGWQPVRWTAEPPALEGRRTHRARTVAALLLAGTQVFPTGLAAAADAPKIRRAVDAPPEPKTKTAAAPNIRPAVDAAASHPDALDQDVLKKASSMTVPQLLEMVQVYLRLENAAMTDKLIALIVKQDPSNAELRRLLKEQDEVRVDEQDAGDDPEAIAAGKLMATGDAAGAVAILQQLRQKKYPTGHFPYLIDLADAQASAGNFADAQTSFRQVIASKATEAGDREDARLALAELELTRIEFDIAEATKAGLHQKALDLADALLRKAPKRSNARLLRAEALRALGRNAEAEREFAAVAYNTDASLDDRLDARRAYNEGRVDRLLEAGDAALTARNRKEVARIADALVSLDPTSPDVLAFRGQALTLNNRPQDAINLLEKARRQNNAKGQAHFEALPALATAYEAVGRFEDAERAWREASNDRAFDFASIHGAREKADELRRLVRGGSDLQATITDQSEGRWTTLESTTHSPLLDCGGQVSVRLSGDWISLADAAVRGGDDFLFDAEVAYRQWLRNGYAFELGAGATSGGDPLFHAEFGRTWPSGISWAARFDFNERATDSLALRSLDGRQHRVSLSASGDITSRLSFDATVYWRQLEIDGERLGSGFGAYGSVNFIAAEETVRRPEVVVSYVGEYSQVDIDGGGARALTQRFGKDGVTPGDFAGDLVDETFHRHGVQLTLTKHFNDRLTATMSGGVSYDFEQKDTVLRAGAGLSYRVNDRVHLNAGAEYESSGRAGNSDDSVITATAGVTIQF